MITDKKEFRERIESLRTVKCGCYSFYKWGAQYRLKYLEGESDVVKIFENFEEFWDKASHYIKLELAINAPKGQQIPEHKETNELPVLAQWGKKRRCVVCNVWKWPREYDEYSSTIIDASDWCRECMSKRDISPRGEECIRLAHHDLGYCHTQKEVAEELGLSEATVSNELAEVRKVAPSLFPLLTELEAECCDCYINEGMIQANVAIYLTSLKYLGPVTKGTVASAIARARAKGFHVMAKRFRGPGKMLRFDNLWMSERTKHGARHHGDIKQRF